MVKQITITPQTKQQIDTLLNYVAGKLMKTKKSEYLVDGTLFYGFIQGGVPLKLSVVELVFNVIPQKFIFKWNRDHATDTIDPLWSMDGFGSFVNDMYDYIKRISLNFTVVLSEKTAL